MKVKLKSTLTIFIDEINVEDGEYEIHYRYVLDNAQEESDMYGSDFDGWTIAEWRKYLKDGEAMKIVRQRIAEDIV